MSYQLLINNNEVINIVTAEFNDTLNEINKAIINLTAQNTFEKSIAQIDDIVTLISINKTYKFKIINRAFTENASIKLVCMGLEEIFANVDIDVSNLTNASTTTSRAGIYNSVSASTILSDLISHISGWSISTTISETVSNIRFDESMSVWNGLARLANQQGYEIDVNYNTNTIIVESNLGNNQVAILNEKIDFEGVPTYTEERAKAKRVIVYGKGDGVYQVKATASDAGFTVGDPTIKINEPNYLTTAQAQKRADLELGKLKQNIKHYVIPQINNFDFNLSDTIIVNSSSVDLENVELKIVQIILSISGNNFFYSIEVTNAEYSRAFKTSKQKINEQNLTIRENNLTNQGSGNTLNWARGLNANSSAPLRTVFFIPDDYVSESGDLDISSLRVDYEVEPFRVGAGSASEDDVSPNFRAGSDTDLHNHNVNENGQHDHVIPTETSTSTEIVKNYGVDFFSEGISTSGWDQVASVIIGDDVDIITCQTRIAVTSSSGANLWYRIDIAGDIHALGQINSNALTGNEYVINDSIPYSPNSNNDNAVLYLRSFSGSISVGSVGSFDSEFRVFGTIPSHSHTIDSFATNNENILVNEDNESPNLNGGAESHNHNVSISSSVSDAASINATQVSLYLDYWNGTSWVNKHSVLNTGSLLDTDVDISNNGQYPDSTGYWRVRTITNSADADFVETIVRMKHLLSNR